MAKFSLYASSPDGLAQQQMAMERYYTGAAEGNRAADIGAQQFNIQAMIQAQQADEAARVNDSERQMAAFRNQTADAENRRRFDLAQQQDATQRARAEAFQNAFIIPQKQQELAEGAAKLKYFADAPVREAQEKLDAARQFLFTNPASARANLNDVASMFDVKPDLLKPLYDQASSTLAVGDASRLNQAYNARMSALVTARTANGVAYVPTVTDATTIRNQVESEAGKIHPSVKYDSASWVWRVGGASPQAMTTPAALLPAPGQASAVAVQPTAVQSATAPQKTGGSRYTTTVIPEPDVQMAPQPALKRGNILPMPESQPAPMPVAFNQPVPSVAVPPSLTPTPTAAPSMTAFGEPSVANPDFYRNKIKAIGSFISGLGAKGSNANPSQDIPIYPHIQQTIETMPYTVVEQLIAEFPNRADVVFGRDEQSRRNLLIEKVKRSPEVLVRLKQLVPSANLLTPSATPTSAQLQTLDRNPNAGLSGAFFNSANQNPQTNSPGYNRYLQNIIDQGLGYPRAGDPGYRYAPSVMQGME